MNNGWRTVSNSDNYKNGSFQNLSATPVMSADASFFRLMKGFLQRPKNVVPPHPLPSVKTNLKSLHNTNPVIIWFGHSSYLIHCNGINILVDPLFSGSASPVPGFVKAFAGADAYAAADMPAIDAMIITHNHYDHLNRKTITQLQSVTRAFYTSLGVGKDLLNSSNTDKRITELDWGESVTIAGNMQLTATPARHFSGRGIKRGGSLWSSFVLKTPGHTIFIGGDSGYDAHFKTIGAQYGPFDLVILECGQYNTLWPLIHMMPEETVQAAIDLKAKMLLPVHWSKFILAYHPWNEPVTRVVKSAHAHMLNITTPMIGEPVILGEQYPNSIWWNL